MTTGYDVVSIASGATGLFLILLFTIPAVSNLTSTLSRTKKYSLPKIYEDKDGVATEESMAEFSAKWPKAVIAVLSVLGLAVSTALAILETLGLAKDGLFIANWLNSGAWSLLVLQAIAIALSKLPTKNYELGIYGTISSIFLLIVAFVQDSLVAQKRTGLGPVPPFVLRVIQLGLIILIGFAYASIPRRPTIFKDGKPVDGGETDTLFSKYSFAWAAPLLRLAIDKKTLDLADLPLMDHNVRSKDATRAWLDADLKHALWINVILQYKWAITLQWFLTLLQAFGNVAPQFALLNILKLLELRGKGASVSSEAWIWVIALGLSTTLASWFEGWLFWISQAALAIPIRAQLASLVFQKAMRRKDIKGITKASRKDGSELVGTVPDPEGISTATDKPETLEEDESEAALTKQSTINLIAVDARRVADFASFNNFFPGSVFKLAVSFAFLIVLIGWKALIAGLATMLLIMPLNIFFSRRYAAAQTRLMKMRDEKLGVVTEALQGLRQLKFMSIERQWQEKIGDVRAKELVELWASYKADTMLFLCWISSPILFSAASLSVYAALYGELTPSVAFTAIGIFKQLEVTLAAIPELTTMLIDSYVSINRIEKYLNAPEISVNTKDSPNVSFDNASFAWPSDEEKEDGDLKYVLRNVNVSFPENELSVISGKTGTGKSMLLSAILGEVDILSGSINVPKPPPIWERHDHKATKDNWIIPSSIAYVAQIPWIENATIKDNILFGLPFDEARYIKTLEVCALRKDLEMLPDGESTEIGANGINLSGGQKWRLTFARALYSRAGILILDDIFSAVDAHVGRFIFEQGLTGELGSGRTRILVTHHVALCKPRTKYLVELGDGTVEHAGLLSELEEDGTLTRIISQENNAVEDEDSTAVNSEESSDIDGEVEVLKKVDSKVAAKKFVEEENREKGAVSRRIYGEYLKASGGYPFWIAAIVLFVTRQSITLGRSWWLKLWTGSYEDSSSHSKVISSYTYSFQTSMTSLQNPTSGKDTLMYYLSVYVGISILASLIGTFQFFYIFTGSVRASKRLFEKLTWTVLRTPLRWIDTVPLGRILNRFTADFTVVDSRLAMDVSFFASQSLILISIIIAGLFVSSYIMILALSLAALCLYYASHYITGAREVKRLESNAKSPIFEQFGSALSGVATIRAFDNTATYISRMYARQDDHSSTQWYLWLFNRWIGWRMSMVGALFAVTVAAVIITIPYIDAALAGFALAFSLEYTGAIIWVIRHYTNLELDLNSAERIIEYSNLPTETQEGAEPPAAWPSEGRLEVRNLVVGYAPDLPPVLKGLTFSVQRNERVGVVGRTGAGKSSLTLALFRFLEAREGNIVIDGIDISKIKLHSLRSRLAIIPQDPVLFSGTVRSNLDAFGDHEDEELQDALARVHLVSSSTSTPTTETPNSANSDRYKNTNPFNSLLSPITESGLNLSQGQRQLLCLARAIVSRPKIMILDEATSAVDMETDTLIQRSIREEFNDSTLIVIAHRLSTISDFDKILVMEEGRGVEFGTPRELLAKENGSFASMVNESGEREKLKDLILGRGAASSS